MTLSVLDSVFSGFQLHPIVVLNIKHANISIRKFNNKYSLIFSAIYYLRSCPG